MTDAERRNAETVERMARAICVSNNTDDPDATVSVWLSVALYQDDATAALATLTPGTRFLVDGQECVVVPVVPTERMIDAMHETAFFSIEYHTDPSISNDADVYSAMIAAAK